MVSTASSSATTPTAQFHSYSWSHRCQASKKPLPSSQKCPSLLSKTSPFPFPLFNLKSPPIPIPITITNPIHHLPPLSEEAVHENYIEFLDKPAAEEFIRQITVREWVQESKSRIFIRDPPWMYTIFRENVIKKKSTTLREPPSSLEVRKMEESMENYNLLRRRQIREETEAWNRVVEEYEELEREMRDKQLAPNLPHVKALFLGWFEPLREAIAADQQFQRNKPRNKAAYAPHIDLLPADKMAVIVMHKIMGLVMVAHTDGCVEVVQAALLIGMAIEQEVMVQSLSEKTKNVRRRKKCAETEEDTDEDKEMHLNHLNSLLRRKRYRDVRKLVKEEDFQPWTRDMQAKLGTRLIDLLMQNAFVQPPPEQQFDEAPPDVRPAFIHKLKLLRKNPRQKHLKRYGVIQCDPLLLKELETSAKHMFAPYMPMLVPPRRWEGCAKGAYFYLPSYAMRTHGSTKQQDALKGVSRSQMPLVYEALDTLGSLKWRVNKRILAVVESIWAQGGNVGGLVDRADLPVPKEGADPEKLKRDIKLAKKVNRERYSQRCDIELKLSVAQKMKDEEGFYYPHNLDFRGRAYPMHQHLNHLGSDLCRGILEFAEGRALGKSGLRWLKIHLANLYAGGVDKLSHDGRIEFVENHLGDIFDSADNPLDGNRWWLTAEDPFQCLAACIDLSEALRSSSPCTVISHLPIHQDGSCNGLQHYAALGRDSRGGAAVNLVASEKPADVYSEIAARVHEIMKRDSSKDPETYPDALLAMAVVDQVDRKLVKQTVMTSVYGVTFVGAREQIKKRLEEKGVITDEGLLYTASCYAAKVTLTALEEIFDAARGMMDWLGDCAKLIASENEPVRWTTPLGLPVVQPYFCNNRHLIRTTLQLLALQRDSDQVDKRRQKTAFPPNFVHSLDGSHMMMTAIACKRAGLNFAGVHDSFWTHACDVDTMNRILRQKFVELYNIPILENLLESFETSYPKLKFPELPKRGDLDLQQVLSSPYFFN